MPIELVGSLKPGYIELVGGSLKPGYKELQALFELKRIAEANGDAAGLKDIEERIIGVYTLLKVDGQRARLNDDSESLVLENDDDWGDEWIDKSELPPREIVDYESKEKFWKDIIRVSEDHVRLVSYRDLDKANQIIKEIRFQTGPDRYDIAITREPETNTKMFVPTGVNQNFNLVHSLCTDGLHRPVLDLDFTKEELQFQEVKGAGVKLFFQTQYFRQEVLIPTRAVTIVASTNHCHLYVNKGMTWPDYLDLLAQIPGDDAAKYLQAVYLKGFGSLRPPWIKKKEG